MECRTSALYRGLSLIETIALLGVIIIAVSGALSIYASNQSAEQLSQERRLASYAAAQKIDEIRIFLQAGNTLDQAFLNYGPLPIPTGGPGATFDVPGLTAFTDFDPADGNRPNPRAVGTVTIINDEVPNEAMFGYDYANQSCLPPFGVDINSNGSRRIETGFGSVGAKGYNDAAPWPFPMDLNVNGSNGTPAFPWESNVLSGLVVLPVVITIQWQSGGSPRRYDVFTLITPIQDTETDK